ncbi:MAG: hypothetical protein H6853_00410 [Rhodospirillales bacterium]|nr:hypothetical protein [Alphaproteobacteria bacterium]USO03788.1 MAG: hypothetical protein H6853_00410 [Rhodospirillales bacterium]
MSKSEEKKEHDVEVFKRVNRLKLKTGAGLNDGPGKIDQHRVNSANSVVQTMASLYPQEIKNVMSVLYKEWKEIKALPEGEDRSVHVKKMSNTANQIKDLAGTFGYVLMEYFGESLRDYILATDLSKKEHFTIVQAHVDVMAVAFRENLKGDDDEAAVELKKVVQEAIEKYS